MINIDIIHDIGCLQLLQHASGSKKYLRVRTGSTAWLISDTIDERGAYIYSGSAGGVSPADPHNPINKRFNQTSWRYWDGKEWHNGATAVKCITHSSGPPDQVELRSSGEAGEYLGDKMGLYQLLSDGGKGARQGPVYRQRHDGDNQQYYLYRWDMDCKQHNACKKQC